MAVTHFLARVRGMDEPSLYAALPALPRDQIEIIQDAFEDGGLTLSATTTRRIADLLSECPPDPAEPSDVVLPRKMADVMAQRRANGEHLYHPDDDIRKPLALRHGGEKAARVVHRVRNGTDVYDEIMRIDGQDVDDEDDPIDVIKADYAARMLERHR